MTQDLKENINKKMNSTQIPMMKVRNIKGKVNQMTFKNQQYG